jgi:hypothetical protein
MENVFKKIFIFGILERRIIYNYTEYGDTPACIGEKLDLDSQPGILQGFGQQPNETIGTLLEIPLRVLSNEDCYKDFLKESEQINKQVRQTLYDGITDQILCSKLTCDENDFTNTSERKLIKCVSYNRLRLHTWATFQEITIFILFRMLLQVIVVHPCIQLVHLIM